MKSFPVLVGLFLVTFLGAACAPEVPPPPATTRDSAGISIVEHRAGVELPAWILSEQPEAVIGQEARGPAHQLTQVVGALRFSDGRIVVGDRQTREARYFDSQGNHLLTVGGPGEGPGELRNLYAVDAIVGDTLVLGGWPIGSRYWFDPQGEFIKGEVLGPWFPGLLGRTLPNGTLLLDTYPQGSHGNTIETWAVQGTEEFFRPVGVMERVSRDGSQIDTLGLMYGEEWLKIGQLRQNFAMNALPFNWRTRVTWSRDELFIGEMNRPEVRAYGPSGELRRIIRWEPRPVQVTGEDRSGFGESLIERLRRPEQVPDYRRWLSQVPFPETKPAFEEILADDEGRVWVKEPAVAGAETSRWSVYGSDGVAVGSVEIPGGFRVVHVSRDQLLAVWTSALDLEFVHSYRLVK